MSNDELQDIFSEIEIALEMARGIQTCIEEKNYRRAGQLSNDLVEMLDARCESLKKWPNQNLN